MPRSTIEDLKKQREQLTARINREKAREKEKQRKLDTRRKIIIGGVMLKHMECDANFKETIIELLDKHVLERDRKLFEELIDKHTHYSND